MRLHGLVSAFIAGAVLAGCASAPAPAPVAASKPAAAPADPQAEARWNLLKKQEQRLYLLDQQKFGSVSCKLDAAMLDKLTQTIRTTMAPIANKVTMEDTLSDYSLTYSPVSLLHITDPALKITAKPGVQIPDQAKFDDGTKKIVTAFNSLVSGLDTELGAIFSIMGSSDESSFDILYINETADGFSASIVDKRGGTASTLVLAGHTLTTKSTAAAGTTTTNSITQFDALPSGKLIVNNVTVDIDQGGVLIHARSTPTFQKLGQLSFPSHLSVKGSIDALQSSHQDVDMEIDLTGCTLK